MLTMNTDKWIFPLAVCFMCVSSSDKWCYKEACGQGLHVCETHSLSAPLGSSVLLPCNFTNSSLNWVLWSHINWGGLVNLTSDRHVTFLLPQKGRVKAFPNQHSKGKYSIRIDEVQDSDLGCYCCVEGGRPDCHQVELLVTAGTLSGHMWLLIYISSGVAAFILLSISSYLLYSNRTWNKNNNLVGPENEGPTAAASAQPAQVPVQEQLRGVDNNTAVYENDDQVLTNWPDGPTSNQCSPPVDLHYLGGAQSAQSTTVYPNSNQQFDIKREESQRTKHKFHRELFSRLRQASLRQCYANQSEISKHQALSTNAQNQQRAGLTTKKKKKAKDKEYNNPIYNRSTEQLHHL